MKKSHCIILCLALFVLVASKILPHFYSTAKSPILVCEENPFDDLGETY